MTYIHSGPKRFSLETPALLCWGVKKKALKYQLLNWI